MEETSLKEKTAKGLFWGGFSNGMQQLLNLLFGIFLARLLSPSDYGMVGMLTIFTLIASSLQESGFISAIANRKSVTANDYNAVFWFSLSVSVTVYILLFFLAPYIARFYNEPELVPLSRFLFLGFILSSTTTAHCAYMFRNLMVKKKTVAQLSALVVSGTVGVTAAWQGMAYWGIALQSITYIVVSSGCYWWLTPWRPSFHIDFTPIREMFGFSSRVLATNIFLHINNNLFSVLLGRYYSEKEVGQFNQANKWNLMGHSLISGMVNSVALPVLRQVSDDKERQRRVFRKMLRFTSFVSFPAMFGLSLIAPELITIAITDKWLPSAHILQLLAVGGAFIPLTNLYTNLIVSKGKSGLFMWNTIIQGLTQLVVMYLLYPYGIRIMLTVYIIINVGWLLIWHYFVWREIRLSIFSALKDILSFGLIAAAVMTAVHFLTAFIQDIYLLISVKIVSASLFYLLIMWASRSATFRESMEYLLKRERKV